MTVAAVLSFVCAAFLAVFISVQRIHTSVPRLAVVLWLFVYNFVHGINALVWSGNVDIHIPVWCDIVTNLILGANLAIPAAFLCISRQLELLSSRRTMSSHPTVRRNSLLLEIFMCYILPILYMLLHLLVQDHRFDLVENLGCSASVDPSAVGFSLMWIPPLLISIISVIFSALSIRNSSCHTLFTTHLESRSTMSYSSFFRCLIISMITTAAAGLFYIFCFFSGPAFHPWSWTAVHATMSQVHIVSSEDEIRSIQLAWWGGFVVSVLYLLLSFVLGEETRDIFQWIKKQASREGRFILPIHFPKRTPLRSSWSQTRRFTFEYKSGWDDMLDIKVSKGKKKAGKAPSLMTSTYSSSTPTLSTVITGDEAFTAASSSDISIKPRRFPPPLSLKVTDNLMLTPPASPLPALPVSCYLPRSGSRSPVACSDEASSHLRYPASTYPDPFGGSSTSSNYDNYSARSQTTPLNKPLPTLPNSEFAKESGSM